MSVNLTQISYHDDFVPGSSDITIYVCQQAASVDLAAKTSLLDRPVSFFEGPIRIVVPMPTPIGESSTAIFPSERDSSSAIDPTEFPWNILLKPAFFMNQLFVKALSLILSKQQFASLAAEAERRLNAKKIS